MNPDLRRKIVAFARSELTQDTQALDREEEFNQVGWDRCGTLGILGLLVPQAYGGQGMNLQDAVTVLEALGYACKDNGLLFALNAHLWACVTPIWVFGTEAQKRKYLPRLCSGEWIGGHALTESGAGSDIHALATTARRVEGGYVLNGHKTFITNGPLANLIIVFAKTEPPAGRNRPAFSAFLVERETPGFVLKRKLSKMGVRTAQMGELHLDNCRVPAGCLLGPEGGGELIFSHSMEWERGFILSSAVGRMEHLLERCIEFARTRRQFGRPIGEFQEIQNKIVSMKLHHETARMHLGSVVRLKSSGSPAYVEAALAKLAISEGWIACATEAMQIHGGSGYLTETELERELRDALASRIYSGTSEIQRRIVARFLGLGSASGERSVA
jgi:alkylation response protein AidB-like acyl-CoA dehydrogenase